MKTLPVHAACLSGNKNALKKIIASVSRRVLEIRDSLGRTPLILSAIYNHVECGTLLLKAGAHVDNSDNAGQTALQVAASKGFHSFVKLLLSYKASWMQGDYFGVTSLHMAAVHPSVKCLSMILKYLKPGETDIQDSTMKTPLHWSAAYAYNDHIKLLLAQGANICIPDEDGKTPLHWAASNSDPEALECVKTLLKKEVSLINWQDYLGRSALHMAVASGSVEVLYFLISKEDCNIDVLDNSFCTPLHWAAKMGFAEKADILLKKRASHSSADDNGATPLHYAAHNDYAQTVEVFMSRQHIYDEADILGRNALMWAAIRNAEAALNAIAASNSALLSWGDKNGTTALHAAAVQGHVSVIELLLTLGVHIDLTDKNGMTPFLKSCEVGRSKTAQLLLNLGADIHACDFNRCTALHWCARGGHAYLSQILLKCGANSNVQDSLRMTPLHCASVSGDYVNCISVLLESNANPNAVDFEGKTPLHFAVLNERKGIVRLLCEHDSDLINAMFLIDDWVTPLDCASLRSNSEITYLLKKYGGICAMDIKESAAIAIQTWFRGKSREKIFTLKTPETFSCHAESFEFPSDRNKCFPAHRVPLDLRNTSVLYHECKGCFHRIQCQHVCSKDIKDPIRSIHHKAAIIIQKCYRKYMMQKRFLRIRSSVLDAFNSDDDRMVAEESWQLKLMSFYSEMVQ